MEPIHIFYKELSTDKKKQTFSLEVNNITYVNQ